MFKSISALTAPLAAAVLLAAAGTAQAHAHLMSSIPAEGAVVGHIKQIELHYTEALAPKFSTVDLTMTSMMMGGKMMDDSMKITNVTAAPSPTDPTTLLVSLKAPLAPGGYTLTWHAVASNSHRTEGTVSFKVQ